MGNNILASHKLLGVPDKYALIIGLETQYKCVQMKTYTQPIATKLTK